MKLMRSNLYRDVCCACFALRSLTEGRSCCEEDCFDFVISFPLASVFGSMVKDRPIREGDLSLQPTLRLISSDADEVEADVEAVAYDYGG